MIKVVLGILQALARAFFVIMSVGVICLLSILWLKFFKEGGKLSLDAIDVNVFISGQALSESAVEGLKAALNESTLKASLALAGFTVFCLFLLLPFYLVQQILLSLKHDKWFAEGNTKRLKYLAFYFITMALLEVAVYSVGFYFVRKPTLGLSFEPGYLLISLGILLLSYMHQQGVKLRQETDLTV
jgi:hypothetical protein